MNFCSLPGASAVFVNFCSLPGASAVFAYSVVLIPSERAGEIGIGLWLATGSVRPWGACAAIPLVLRTAGNDMELTQALDLDGEDIRQRHNHGRVLLDWNVMLAVNFLAVVVGINGSWW